MQWHRLHGVFATIPTMHATCAPQVDGTYEDWVEVLRLIYHSGGTSQLGSSTHGHICVNP